MRASIPLTEIRDRSKTGLLEYEFFSREEGVLPPSPEPSYRAQRNAILRISHLPDFRSWCWADDVSKLHGPLEP